MMSELIQVIAVASAPFATVAVAFFTFLNTRTKASKEDLEKARAEANKLKKDNEAFEKNMREEMEEMREQIEEFKRERDAMLNYIYAMRRRDFQEGRDPLPLPSELSLG